MDKDAKKSRYYSIMIVPHDAQGRPISIKIPASWVYGMLTVVCVSLVVVTSSLVYSAVLSRRMVNYAGTISRSQEQQATIDKFSDKTNKVLKAIGQMMEEENELRRMLGLKSWKSKIQLGNDKPTKEVVTDQISRQLKLADLGLREKRASLKDLKGWVAFVQNKMATTPSIWPVQGRINSYFGYRIYPWRGFHAGIDIKAVYGAPARATAAGVVAYTGWRHGYGKTVEIDHGHGVRTLYGHNSSFAVRVGQRVKKGEIICYVGTTGWTTGSHLHYEVQRYGDPLNPVVFLDQNIMSASRLWGGKIWD